MHPRLATTPEEIAAATSAYPVPFEVRNGWKVIDPMAANALTARIAAEIVELTGCTARVASVAAGGFVNMRNAPGWGLNDGTPLGSDAYHVLSQWLAAKVQAHRQAQRVAA